MRAVVPVGDDRSRQFEVRLVSHNGGVRWYHHRVPVTNTLSEEYVGFELTTTNAPQWVFAGMDRSQTHNQLLACGLSVELADHAMSNAIPGGATAQTVIKPDGDLLLALTQAAADKYGHDLKPSGILVVDSTKVVNMPSGNFAVHRVPIIETAKETVGKAMVANIVSLGVIAVGRQGITGVT